MADPLSAKAAEANRPPPAYDEAFPDRTTNSSDVNPTVESNGQLSSEAYAQQNDSNRNRETDPTTHNNNNYHNVFMRPRSSPYGPYPIEMDCPYCQCHIVSHIDRVAGLLPWILFGICAVLGFIIFLLPWCFCCLPFCIDQCLDVTHTCPACKRHLGRFNRI